MPLEAKTAAAARLGHDTGRGDIDAPAVTVLRGGNLMRAACDCVRFKMIDVERDDLDIGPSVSITAAMVTTIVGAWETARIHPPRRNLR